MTGSHDDELLPDAESERPGEPFRTVWHSPMTATAADVEAQRALRMWFAAKPGIDLDAVDDGRSTVGDNATLLRVRQETADGSQSARWQLRETGQPGVVWRTTLTLHTPRPRAGAEDRTWFWVESQGFPRRGPEHPPKSRIATARTPGLVRHLLDLVDAYDGSALLRTTPTTVRPDDVDHLLDVLCDPDRRLPAVVGTLSRRLPDWRDTLDVCLHRLPGLASLYVLDPAATDLFTQTFGRDHAVWGGAVRTYWPDVDPAVTDDALRHRVLSARRIESDPAKAAWLLATEPQRQAAASRLPDTLSRLRLSLQTAGELARADATPPPTTPAGDGLLAELARLRSFEAAAEALLDEADAARQSQADGTAGLQERLNDALAQLESRNVELQTAEDRVRTLRRRLIADGRERDANAPLDAEDHTVLPGDLYELLDALDGLEHVEWTGDEEPTLALDVQAERTVWAQTAWQALLALDHYVAARAADNFTGSFRTWCADPPSPGRGLPLGKIKMGETPAVKSNPRMARQRTLPVPAEVDPSGYVLMEDHITLGGAPCYPRMYFFLDPHRSGKAYIGYIGEHLENWRTRSR